MAKQPYQIDRRRERTSTGTKRNWSDQSKKKKKYPNSQLAVGRSTGSGGRSRSAVPTRGSSVGESPRKNQTGAINRVFDVLSRGQYGSAEAIRSSNQAYRDARKRGESSLRANLGSVDELASGWWEGITGRKKTSFADVLEEGGVKNKAVRGTVGFLGDILLDPTTYVGAGLVKGVGREAATKLSGRAFANTLRSKPARKAGEAAAREAFRSGAGKTTVERAAAFNAGRENFALDIANKVKDKQLTKRGRIEVKVGGKNVLPKRAGEAGYSVAKSVLQKIGNTPVGDTLNKGFRTKALFPENVNFIKRTTEGRGTSEFNAWAREFNELFKPLTASDGERISFAREAGEDLTGVLGENGADLGDFQRKAQGVLDDMFDKDLDSGILREDQKLDNYVPHVFRKVTPKTQAWKARRTKAVGTETPGFAKDRVTPELTLRKAFEEGLDPVTDIRELVKRRVAKSYEVHARNDFVQAVAMQYGVRGIKPNQAGKLGLKSVDSEFLGEPVYFPEGVANALGAVERAYDSDEVTKGLLRHYDQVLGIWKGGVTVLRPGFHTRNLLGDIFFNFEAGVVNPSRYRQAAAIMGKKSDQDLLNVKVRVGKREITGKEIRDLYNRKGLGSSFYHEEFEEAKAGLERFNNLPPMRAARKVAEVEQDFARYANFIDGLVKEGRTIPKRGHPNGLIALDKAADKAAIRVRKFNLDYGDLTEFERYKLKRIMPFYTFMSKNLPLQLEMIATKPGRVSVVPKAQSAIERLLGADKQEASVEEAIPQWILEQSTAVTAGDEPLYSNPGLPITQLGMGSGGGQGFMNDLVNSITPGLKIPLEVATGKSLFTGAPREEGLGYAVDQLPFGRSISKMADSGETGDAKLLEALNFLLGGGLQRATTERQESELRRQKMEAG